MLWLAKSQNQELLMVGSYVAALVPSVKGPTVLVDHG